MSKCLVKNTINNRTYGFALPCGGAEAKAFCDGLADQMNRSNRWYKLVCASQYAENQLGLS